MSTEVEKWKKLYEQTKREKEALSVAKNFFEQKYLNSVKNYSKELEKIRSEHVSVLNQMREAVKKLESKLDNLSKNINLPNLDQNMVGQVYF